jgi:hypothetical protein
MTTSELQDLRAVGVLGGATVDHELTALIMDESSQGVWMPRFPTRSAPSPCTTSRGYVAPCTAGSSAQGLMSNQNCSPWVRSTAVLVIRTMGPHRRTRMSSLEQKLEAAIDHP